MLSPKISLVETDRIRICWQILLSLLTISVKKKGGGGSGVIDARRFLLRNYEKSIDMLLAVLV